MATIVRALSGFSIEGGTRRLIAAYFVFKSLFFALFWHLWLCWRASYFISDHLLFKNLLRTLALWLAAKQALFSCNDQALPTRCPRHIQSVLNLIDLDILMDIHVMVNWQLSKRYLLTSVTWLYCQLKCTTHWGDVFF